MQDKRPNFFMMGAQKTGTSSFYSHLLQYPDIFVPTVKELHYFSYFEGSDTYYDIPFVKIEAEFMERTEDTGAVSEIIGRDLSSWLPS